MESKGMTHFRDPCIHCGKAMEDFAIGACPGDRAKAIPIAYRSLGVRWDNVERFWVRFSDSRVEETYRHISEQAPFWHFGYSDELRMPPRYDEKIVR